MKQKDREYIGATIRHELKEDIHIFSPCKCGRHGCKTHKCWECWLNDLVSGRCKELEEKELD